MTRQYHLPLPQSEAMSLEDFLPSSANEEGLRWLVRIPPRGWPSHALVLCGPAGSGKTHLLNIWLQQNQARQIEPCDTLLDEILHDPTVVPAVALDDAHRIVGQDEQEVWLQHFYNATKAAEIPFLLTANAPPAAWGLSLRDIETRLKSCACAQLHEPDDELMRGLLLKLFADRQLLVDTGVVDYLAPRIERTGTAIRDIVARLDEASLETGHKISVPFAQKFLGSGI